MRLNILFLGNLSNIDDFGKVPTFMHAKKKFPHQEFFRPMGKSLFDVKSIKGNGV